MNRLNRDRNLHPEDNFIAIEILQYTGLQENLEKSKKVADLARYTANKIEEQQTAEARNGLRVSQRHLFWNTFRQKKKRLLASLFERFFFSENKHIIISFGDTLFFGALQLFTAKEFARRKKKVTGVLRTNHHQQEGTILLCRRCKRVFTLIMP